MTINQEIRLFRLATGIGAAAALLCLLVALEQVVYGLERGDNLPLDSSRLRSSLEARDTTIDELEQKMLEADQRLIESQKLYQEEILINEALREDLQKATARLRRGSAK